MAHYEISAEAQTDLFAIWQRIAEDRVECRGGTRAKTVLDGRFYSSRRIRLLLSISLL
jgi:hypothetical protein